MPANVTVEFEKARLAYQQASSPKAKLDALVEMQKLAPGHKGGENLRKDISRKIALLKKEIEKQRAKEKKKGSAPGIAVKKEGIGQIVLVGLPNSGKSWLLHKLTNVEVEIAAYPFTTKKPVVGMLDFKGTKIQLVELPGLVRGSSRGKANGLQLLSIARNADALVLVARGHEEEQLLIEELKAAKILLNEKRPGIEIKQSKFRGIAVVHKKNLKIREEQLEKFLKKRGLFNVSVILNEALTSLKVLDLVLDDTIVYKKSLTLNAFGELDWQKLKERLFKMLDKVLVYTKKAGGKADMERPLALPLGSTVEDAAKHLHKELAGNFKYAKVWGSSKYPGQKVQKGYKLKNGDIIEICC